MARPSTSDPIDKFRFEVNILDQFAPDASYTLVEAFFGNFKNFRAGFSEVQIPTATVTEIEYRENVDVPAFKKQPGLVKYDKLVLRRGVTLNSELYEWLKTTSNVVMGVSSTTAAIAAGFTELGVVPVQKSLYRKDLVVSAKDRNGNYIKHWFFYNCFVSSYKPGNDLNASTDEKLIEELGISFEVFIESKKQSINEALSDIQDQITQQFTSAAVTAVL